VEQNGGSVGHEAIFPSRFKNTRSPDCETQWFPTVFPIALVGTLKGWAGGSTNAFSFFKYSP